MQSKQDVSAKGVILLMLVTRRFPIASYGLGLAGLVVAVLLRKALDPAIWSTLPFVTLFGAIALAVWFGGTGPALVVTILGYVAAELWIIDPSDRLSFSPSSLVGMVAYFATGAVIIWLGRLHNRAEHKALVAAGAAEQQAETVRVTLASIGDAVITTDAHGKVDYINDVAAELTGWTNEEARGKPLVDVFRIVNEETGEPVENPVAKALELKRVVGLANHTVLIAKDGRESPIEDSAAPIRTADGEIKGVVLVFHDVSERRYSAKALERSERELSDFFESTHIGLQVVDADGKIVRANQAQLDLVGLEAEQYVGSQLSDTFVQPEAASEIMTTLKSGHEVRERAVQLLAKGSEPRDVLINANALFEDGKLIYSRFFTLDVSDRLRASHTASLLSAIVQDSDDAIVSKTLEGTILTWNDGAHRLYGFSAEEAVGQSIEIIIPDHLRDEERNILARLANGERIAHYETARRARNGNLLDISLTISPIRDPSGKIIAASKVARDITNRKKADAALLESEQKLRLALEGGQMGTWSWVVNSDHVDWSPRLEAIYGFAPGEFDGRFDTYRDRVHPDDREMMLNDIQASLASGNDHKTVHRIQLPDGSTRWIEGSGRVVRDETGRPLGMIGVAADITDRKNAEYALDVRARQHESLFQLADNLQNARSLADVYQAALEAITTALPCEKASILLYDGAKVMRFVAWKGLSDGYRAAADGHSPWSPNERNAQPLTITDIEDSDVGEPLRSVILQEGIRALAFIPLILDGRLIGKFMAYFSRPHSLNESELEVSLTTARQLAAAIGRMRAESALREADRRKDEFLATLAHELRGPLAPLRNMMELIRDPRSDMATHQVARDTMERQLAHLVRLVDDLLDLSRISRDRLELRKQIVEIQPLIHQALESCESLATTQGHKIKTDLPETPIFVEADPVRLVQVFANLLNNACKYTEPGGTICVEARTEGSQLVTEIKDTGIGIAEDKLAGIFEMFSQVDEALKRSQGGLGIGLALTKRLVELHGGSVQAQSEGLGKGSVFSVRLPLADSVAVQMPEESHVPASERQRTRILVVDDNHDAATSLSMLLELMGHEVRTGFDGEEAVRIAQEFAPSICILDIGLPKLNGYEAAAAIRSHEWGRDMVLIALTGWGQENDRRRAIDAGFDKHLVKPVDPPMLLSMIGGLNPIATK